MQSRSNSGGNTPKLIVGIVALVLGVGFAACGGDDSTPTEGSNSSETTFQDPGSGSKQKGQSKENQGKSKNAAKSKGSSSSSQSSAPTAKPVKPVPLRVSGGGSKQFREKGGDNSIQEYGDESDESELQAAAEAVHGFYVARSEEDWTRACSYLAKSMVDQFEVLAEQSPELKDRGCAPVLKAFTRPLPVAVRRKLTMVDAASLRREDERGFLIYYDSEHKPFAMPLKDEDGVWKLTLLAATPLG